VTEKFIAGTLRPEPPQASHPYVTLTVCSTHKNFYKSQSAGPHTSRRENSEDFRPNEPAKLKKTIENCQKHRRTLQMKARARRTRRLVQNSNYSGADPETARERRRTIVLRSAERRKHAATNATSTLTDEMHFPESALTRHIKTKPIENESER